MRRTVLALIGVSLALRGSPWPLRAGIPSRIAASCAMVWTGIVPRGGIAAGSMERAVAAGASAIDSVIHHLFRFAHGISCDIHRLADCIFHILRLYLPKHPVKLRRIKLFFPFSVLGPP